MELTTFSPECFLLDYFLSPAECSFLIEKFEAIGFEEAPITTEKGFVMRKDIRNNLRIMLDDQPLADELWGKLEPFAPRFLGKFKAVGLNERFRIYKYLPGQQFKMHRDGAFERNIREVSFFTFLVYLNEDYSGGRTLFTKWEIDPQSGSGLVFRHNLLHEGEMVEEGVKYVLRSDIMYRLMDREEN